MSKAVPVQDLKRSFWPWAKTPTLLPFSSSVYHLNSETPQLIASTMEKSQYTITHQPISQAYMSPTCPPPQPQGGCCGKNKCHARRLRVLLPALLALVTIASLALWLWCSGGMGDLAADVGSSLWKRQSSPSNGDSPFVKNKLRSRTRCVARATYARAVAVSVSPAPPDPLQF
ncbi:hypothetical protein FRC11_003970 [Ceratobasidium sp. 423]|nr:hypothetical protein FRC11_003970 [Ceratobasidium sp. 423]